MLAFFDKPGRQQYRKYAFNHSLEWSELKNLKFSITKCNTVLVGPKCQEGRPQHVKSMERERGVNNTFFLIKALFPGPISKVSTAPAFRSLCVFQGGDMFLFPSLEL